jgi:hypothetical protein
LTTPSRVFGGKNSKLKTGGYFFWDSMAWTARFAGG